MIQAAGSATAFPEINIKTSQPSGEKSAHKLSHHRITQPHILQAVINHSDIKG